MILITIKQDYNAYGQAKRTMLEETPQFNGEMLSSGNLTYMRARNYDSTIGQFTSKDTWLGRQTNPLSQNRNTFMENNRINNVDPSGHFLAYMIVDDVTKSVVQISDNITSFTWVPDSSIIDPYITS